MDDARVRPLGHAPAMAFLAAPARPSAPGLALLVLLLLVASPARAAETTTFTTAGEHPYVVPAGVTRLAVTATGGQGGSITVTGESRPGGRAAQVTGTLEVIPGQTLHAVVGASASGTAPGANGGGPEIGRAHV